MVLIDKVGALLVSGSNGPRQLGFMQEVQQSITSLNEPTIPLSNISLKDGEIVLTRKTRKDGNESSEDTILLRFNKETNTFTELNDNVTLTRNQILAHAIMLIFKQQGGKVLKVPSGINKTNELQSVLAAYIKKYLQGKYGEVKFVIGKDTKWEIHLERPIVSVSIDGSQDTQQQLLAA